MTDNHKTPVLNNSTSINELIILADRLSHVSESPKLVAHPKDGTSHPKGKRNTEPLDRICPPPLDSEMGKAFTFTTQRPHWQCFRKFISLLKIGGSFKYSVSSQVSL